MNAHVFPRLRHLLACTLLVAALPGTALVRADEPRHPVKPLLWKIEGNGLEKPSFLFGTIHLGGGPLAELHPASARAFDSADILYTEIPFDPQTQIAMAAAMVRRDGKTLADSIGPELSGKLDAELKLINPALDSAPFQSLKTWTVALTLPMLPSQLQGDKALDAALWEKAVAAGKQTGSIERPEDQTGIFDSMSDEEQAIILGEVIRMLREDRAAGRNSVDDLLAAYVSGDLEAIGAEMEKSFHALKESEHRELGERLTKRLLEGRDVTMAASIHRSLQEKPGLSHFFAAGAGHFSSDTSIRFHLAERGYRITAITE